MCQKRKSNGLQKYTELNVLDDDGWTPSNLLIGVMIIVFNIC